MSLSSYTKSEQDYSEMVAVGEGRGHPQGRTHMMFLTKSTPKTPASVAILAHGEENHDMADNPSRKLALEDGVSLGLGIPIAENGQITCPCAMSPG